MGSVGLSTLRMGRDASVIAEEIVQQLASSDPGRTNASLTCRNGCTSVRLKTGAHKLLVLARSAEHLAGVAEQLQNAEDKHPEEGPYTRTLGILPTGE